ncbi:Stk1 family PASTA domain-containing Ser/Thr kinase [Streptacidiphilus cavernicola]|uniref:non-specific serine/threonine protein kinase n=1 Tax=Streptacidiphilus cavernicola TaxID=3342716 RepID=A0ABV6VVF4_9ACTN
MEEPRRLGGRYELGGVLGRGGMAEVYLGHDIRLGRAVAVKTLRADMARDPSFQARFRREAQSAASLNHPSIVAVYDTGEDYIDGISIPYIVMEYVDGSTLRELLHSGRRLLPERALEMTTGVLQALEYSHRNGIVHRDIKPANVMLTRNGTVKVMDFGIARAMGDAGMTMTQTAAVIGTAQYLSPEQAKGEQVDARSDLYSTGCLLYELFTMRPPFIGDSPVAVAYQHVREEAQPPSVYDPEVRPEYDAIVMKALAKERDYRYQSADEMRADIERALDGLPVAAVQTVAYGAGAMPGYGQPQGYGQQDQYGRTTAMPQQGADQAGQTSLLPGLGKGYDVGGDGYDTGGGNGYDDGYGGRGDRRRAGNGGGRNRNTSWIVLAVAAVLVLIGSYFVAQYVFAGPKKPTTYAVPNLVNQDLAGAQAAVTNSPGTFTIVKGPAVACDPATADKGKVCTQDPAVGTMAAAGSTITIHVSSGAPTKGIPSVSGKSPDDATAALQAAGFTVSNQTQQASDKVPNGQVIGTNPAAGTQAATGSGVVLIVSSGPAQVAVPNLLGLDQQDATAALTKAGLSPAPQGDDNQPSNYLPGQVSRQSQPAGTMVAPNTSIQFWLTPQQQGGNGGNGGTQTPPQGAGGTTGQPGDNQGQTGQ